MNRAFSAAPRRATETAPCALESLDVAANTMTSVIDTSHSAVHEYHATDYIHVSLDVFRAQHEWSLGDRKQTLSS